MPRKKKMLAIGIACAAVACMCVVSCEVMQDYSYDRLPPPDQSSAQGAVALFKQAADSSDVNRAVTFLCSPAGAPYNALEQYNASDETVRYLNRIHDREFHIWYAHGGLAARDSVDTVNAEFDWLFMWNFIERKNGNKWYIAQIQEEGKQ